MEDDFIVNQLVKVLQTDLGSIVNLRLVPWGNTQIAPNTSWICQHGTDECQLNTVEACAIKVWSNLETHFKLISCIEQLHLQNKHSSWQSCFGSTGLSLNPIENCYNNGLGYQFEFHIQGENPNCPKDNEIDVSIMSLLLSPYQ
uniref:Uncharacterized protein n=1 Tax=Solanum lycopersicum TaxID=4081 RepID=A0A3Q7I1X7_SOLLC